jgi:hypothetical protein
MAQFRTDLNKIDSGQVFTRYEVNMMSDRLTPSGTLTDAFGSLRVTQPFTLFESTHRFTDNGLWATSNTAGNSSYNFVTNQSTIDMNVGTTANAEVIRETTRVFSYQPGKSLLIMQSLAMNTPKANLRQRAGYFGQSNGIYFENDGTTNYFVLRSNTSSTVTETRVAQSDWNVDKFDGTGYSSQLGGAEHANGLNVSKTNIFWMDIEWLGVGDVRCGFIVDGKMIPAHIFHNDNRNTVPYMTTASLPLRLEIKNTGVTESNSTLSQICSTVISEGGYELTGSQQAVQTSVGTPVDLPTAGVYYPIISIRLKTTPNRLDAIVILTALSILGITNNAYYNWQVRAAADTSGGGTWVSAGDNSAVEYKLDGGSVTGGRILASGFTGATTQSISPVDILKEALFKFQLERNSLTGTPYELTLVVAASSNGADIYGSMDWEEITR